MTSYDTLGKWNKRFLLLAEHIAQWSKDPSTQCGAVITRRDNTIVSMGFNGLPRGVEDSVERLAVRDIKYQLIIHAETNALMYARQRIEDCQMYTWPLMPCAACAGKIIQSGINHVFAPRMSEEIATRWKESVALTRELFKEAFVAFTEVG